MFIEIKIMLLNFEKFITNKICYICPGKHEDNLTESNEGCV